ncbi:caspase family protein [Tabrizicola sp.]|uniref:caspase family protein n=1 Tax=Tabrizicola sp. TaxID=2005166 RepID=UPI00286B294A|nr:caspase family protein [Tabrizicola sp.]
MLRRVGLVVLLWVGLATAAAAERRVALVLAAENYKLIRPLTNPDNDARAMEALLENLDFEVFVETDRDLRRMRRALDDFRQDGAGADVALVFFAGHGVALDGVNYLLPTDADASSAAKLVETALPLSELQDVLRDVAPVSIVLLDACRDDPFSGSGTGTEGDRTAAALDDDPPTAATPKPGLGRIGRADGVLFAFAASPNETASDGTEENSPFTAALIRHFGTAGVELRTALTLVQQDVYDRSRGKQLPYIESGLPELVFITGEGVLPERDQLLIAMADLTPDLRAEVEALALARNMPLAPLYAALLSADLGDQTPDERARLLLEAANSYEQFQSELQRFQSDDPRVADLRRQAEEQLSLGAFDTARALLTEAAEIDASARTSIRETYLSRTISEAATHVLNANAARTDLRYDLAISDLSKAVALYTEVENEELDRDTGFAFTQALSTLGDLQLVAGNTKGALASFSKRSAFSQKQVEADPADVAWVRELIWSLNSVGSVLQQQGYLKEAEAAFSSALEFSQWQGSSTPDDPDLMRDEQVARNNVGVVRFALNDFKGALQAHRDALLIAEALLARDPTSVTYQRDISYTQERIGDVLVAVGDKEGARAAFSTSLEITAALAAEFPADEDIRRDLSVSYERIGDTLIADNDFDGGLERYGQALAIREELAALDPDNKLRQRDLSVTFERIGDINSSRGDKESALLAQQAALAIREKLAALDPTNMLWQRDLSVSHERVGDILYDQNDLAGAMAAHERSKALREGIVALDPQNLPRQRDYGVAIEKIGDVKYALGDYDGAVVLHQQALALRRSLVGADPSVPQYTRDISFSLIKIADCYVAQSRLAEAEPLYGEAVMLRAQLSAAAPQDTLSLRDLSVVQNAHSKTLIDLGRGPEAVKVAQQSIETADRLLAIAPDITDHINDKLVSLNRLGDAYVLVNDQAAAARAFQDMQTVGNRLLDIDPYSTVWANDLSIALERLGDAQFALGDLPAALESHQGSLNLRDWLVQQDSSSAVWYRNLAISYERVASMLAAQENYETALPSQDQSLTMMRDLAAAFPDDPWYKIDVVRALDLKSVLLADGRAENEEALAILVDMRAQGTLPQGYEDWIAAFRKTLGLPAEF